MFLYAHALRVSGDLYEITCSIKQLSEIDESNRRIGDFYFNKFRNLHHFQMHLDGNGTSFWFDS